MVRARMRATFRRMLQALLVLVAVYVAITALFTWQQDRLVFPGAGLGDRGVPPDVAGAAGSTLQRADGGRFRIVTVPPVGAPRAGAGYFLGNREDPGAAAEGARELAGYGLLVVGVEHAGFGSSDGPPSVATFLAGAEAAAAHARALAQQQGVPLLAVGSSVGTFCAVHIAAQSACDRLLLRAPPTSLAAAAKARFWWLPVDLLLRHRFDTLGPAKSVRCPVLVLHGDRDSIVPQRLGRELCAAFAGPAEFVDAAGFDHNDLPLGPGSPFGARIMAFVAGR